MPHKLTLSDRKRLTLTGVSEVVSFDDNAVTLRTSLGMLTIQGRELKLKMLTEDGGQVAIDGSVTALSYEEPKTPGGFWRRLVG
jgi:sporulation protein YabP